MYDELIKRLRERSVFLFPHHGESRSYDADLMHEAANAIEELQATLCNWCAVCSKDKRDLSTCEIYESCRAKPPKEK